MPAPVGRDDTKTVLGAPDPSFTNLLLRGDSTTILSALGFSQLRPIRSGATLKSMRMYLSNRDVRPTGYEPGELVASPTVEQAVEPSSDARDVDDEDETSEA